MIKCQLPQDVFRPLPIQSMDGHLFRGNGNWRHTGDGGQFNWPRDMGQMARDCRTATPIQSRHG